MRKIWKSFFTHTRIKSQEKWLIIGGCQIVGLANCLSIICMHVKIEICDVHKFRSNTKYWKSRARDFQQIIVDPNFTDIIKQLNFEMITFIPAFQFKSFHPDSTYLLSQDEDIIKSPAGDYHSIIIFVAFKSGIPENMVKNFFNIDIYNKIGFLKTWDAEKLFLLDSFNMHGWDLQEDFIKWVRMGLFMHSGNHPRIDVIYDIALKIAKKITIGAVIDSRIVPHDNLLIGEVFPIYPEIADYYGISSGSYFFKSRGYEQIFTLDEFIAKSYAMYKKFDVDKCTVYNSHYHEVMNLFAELI